MSINLERVSKAGAAEVTNGTAVTKRKQETWQSNSALSEVLPADRSEIPIDGLRPEDHQVVSVRRLHKRVSAR